MQNARARIASGMQLLSASLPQLHDYACATRRARLTRFSHHSHLSDQRLLHLVSGSDALYIVVCCPAIACWLVLISKRQPTQFKETK